MSMNKFSIGTFLGLLIMTNVRPAIAQNVVIKNSDVLLPDKSEYRGFKLDIDRGLVYPSDPRGVTICRFELQDPETGCVIVIEFYSKENKRNINDAFVDIPHPEKNFKEGSFSKKISAEYIVNYTYFDDLTNQTSGYNVYLSEGTITLHAQAFMAKKKDQYGNLKKNLLTENNMNRVDNIVIKMLDRMTVLGLTSKPKESAPEWAKRQVAERLAKRKQ